MPASVPKDKLRLHWFGELEPKTDNLWLVDGLLPAQGTALLYAEPQCAKSFLVLDLALHVAEGRHWFDRPVRQGVVVYVAAEGGEGIRNRVEAMRRHTGIRETSVALVFEAIDLYDPTADTDRLIASVREAAQHFDCDPTAVVVDTLSKTFGAGKENTDDMRVYVSNADTIARACNACVILVHHRPKHPDGQKPRGHSSLEAGVDTAILVKRLPAGSHKSEPRFLATVVKQKDGPGGERLAFSLRTIEIARHTQSGQDITSCVVVPSVAPGQDSGPSNGAAIASGTTLVVLNMLQEELNLAEQETGRRWVSRKAVRRRVIQQLASGQDSSPDTARKAYERAEKSLLSQGLIHFAHDGLSDARDMNGT